MDSCLNRLEKFAVSQNADKSNWALSLSARLRGRALDVYSMMSKDDVNDYDKLKAALLKRYQLTADGFRKKDSGHLIRNKEKVLCNSSSDWKII